MNGEKSRIKTVAIEIIKNYIGDTTAQLYVDFYQKQDDAMVMASLSELLEEYVGPDQASEILKKNGLAIT